jgi:hypothetical protein
MLRSLGGWVVLVVMKSVDGIIVKRFSVQWIDLFLSIGLEGKLGPPRLAHIAHRIQAVVPFYGQADSPVWWKSELHVLGLRFVRFARVQNAGPGFVIGGLRMFHGLL